MVRVKKYVLAAVVAGLWGCARAPAPGPRNNAVLITVDTLRADHLECYGNHAIQTPATNRLAAEGVLFQNAIAQAPLTLPSHCSMLTGTYPNATGVRDQAGFVLAPDQTTLAETLHGAGFETAAFVSSTVLGSEYGLKQGFDVYSEVPRTGGAEAERRGDQVIDDVLGWIQTPGRRRFFAWVHLFDPHTPYDPPEPYRSRYAQNPYDGEIAFVDSLIGRLVQALPENTVIVFTADHGESLGEHGEQTHGLLLYDATLRVPLIVKFPGSAGRGRVVSEQVRGIDVVPTILEAVSVAIPGQVQGQSLVALAQGVSRDLGLVAYSETYFPYYHFQWSPLLAVRTGQHKYIHAPKAELYDLGKDPGEKRNLLGESPETAARMRETLLQGYKKFAAPPPGKVDAAAIRRLKSLGYVGAPMSLNAAAPFEKLPDPKDKIRVYNLLQQALEQARQGRIRESNEGLRQVVRQDGRIIDAHLNLGVNYAQLEEFPQAIESFRRALAIDPKNLIAQVNLGLAYASLGHLEEAASELTKTVELDPRYGEAWDHLGRVRQLQGRLDPAILAYREALRLDPGFARAQQHLREAEAQKLGRR